MYQALGLLGLAGGLIAITALVKWINKLDAEERERAFEEIRNSIPDEPIVPAPHVLYWQNRIAKYYEQHRS